MFYAVSFISVALAVYVIYLHLKHDKLVKGYEGKLARERIKGDSAALLRIEKTLREKRGKELSDYITAQRAKLRAKLRGLDKEG